MIAVKPGIEAIKRLEIYNRARGEVSNLDVTSALKTCTRGGLVPRPLISRDFILTEMVSLIQIGIMKKVR